MLKNFCILVFTLSLLASYGQKSTLLQNINFRAKELKHSLSKDGDSLILESERTIYSVEIFNQDYEKKVEVGDKKTKIALNDTPLGRLVVQAKLLDKRILMTLLRHEAIDIQPKAIVPKPIAIPRLRVTKACEIKALTTLKSKTLIGHHKPISLAEFIIRHKAKLPKPKSQIATIEPIDETIDETIEEKTEIKIAKVEEPKLIIEKSTPPNNNQTKSVTSMLNWKRHKTNTKNPKYYWVALETNNGTSSYKTMKLVNEVIADRLISKNKLETKTNNGKMNKLTIWEVYDKDRFMEAQVENPEYINSTSSELFNVVPYYTTSNLRLALN